MGEDRRRAPEQSVLHEAFRRGWPEVPATLPARVKREVERHLQCGDVRFGFAEVTCQSCEESRLVAFSCKIRGLHSTRKAAEERLASLGVHLPPRLLPPAHRAAAPPQLQLPL